MNSTKIKYFKRIGGLIIATSLLSSTITKKETSLSSNIKSNNSQNLNNNYINTNTNFSQSYSYKFLYLINKLSNKLSIYSNNILTCWGKVKKNHDLYLWGNGSSEHTSDYSNFHPHKIIHFYDLFGNDISDKFKRIKQIEFGNYFTAYLNENGELYVSVTPFISGDKEESLVEIESEFENNFEKNSNNKRAYTMNELLFPPSNVRKGLIKVSGNKKVNQVKFTKNQIFFTDNNGKLFMYRLVIGDIVNEDHYIKGPQIPSTLNISSELIEIKEIRNVKQIDSGIDHLMILCNNGSVYGMGDDSFGQLGLGTYSEERIHQMKTYGNFILRREPIPQKLDIDNIEKIACGDNHTILLDNKGNVYGTGFNRFLQLSNDELYRQKYIGLNVPTIINKLSSNAFITDHINGNMQKKVIDIVCSGNCSFFVVEEKIDNEIMNYDVYGAGEGLKGALGINHIRHISDVEMLQDISGLINTNNSKPIKIHSFECGNKHCLMLFKNPRIIFAWGNNEHGELGTQNRAFTESPVPMLEEYTIPNKIIKVFAGKNNSGFIAEARDEEKTKELLELDNKLYLDQIQAIKERKKKKKMEKQKEKNESNQDNTENKEESEGVETNKEETYYSKTVKLLKKYFF